MTYCLLLVPLRCGRTGESENVELLQRWFAAHENKDVAAAEAVCGVGDEANGGGCHFPVIYVR